MAPQHQLFTAASSSPGLLRPTNEDAFLVHPPLLAVADGMGALRYAALASQTAVDVLLHETAAGASLNDAFHAAQARFRALLETLPEPGGLGTTLTAALFDPPTFTLAHIGDSRASLVSPDSLVQLTEDHLHPGSQHILRRYLGLRHDPSPVLSQHLLESGHRLLLATDGLHGMLPDSEILALALLEDLAGAADALIAAAEAAGGRDNITVILAEWR